MSLDGGSRQWPPHSAQVCVPLLCRCLDCWSRWLRTLCLNVTDGVRHCRWHADQQCCVCDKCAGRVQGGDAGVCVTACSRCPAGISQTRRPSRRPTEL
eukprot:2357438-Rhodomonas_salina.4